MAEWEHFTPIPDWDPPDGCRVCALCDKDEGHEDDHDCTCGRWCLCGVDGA